MGTYAANRGWGNPPVPRTRIKTVTLTNGVQLPVHVAIADLVKWLGDETLRRGYKLNKEDSWGYAPRRIRGLEEKTDLGSWSNHAYGLAVDLNATSNPLTTNGKVVTDMPSWVPKLWKEHGFTWGGDYKGKRKDPMHFEFLGTPEDAAKEIAKINKAVVNARRTLRIGMTGADVTLWQNVLIGAGKLASGAADGIFGPFTQAATKKFQEQLGVVVDGIVGPKTWAATDEAIGRLAVS